MTDLGISLCTQGRDWISPQDGYGTRGEGAVKAQNPVSSPSLAPIAYSRISSPFACNLRLLEVSSRLGTRQRQTRPQIEPTHRRTTFSRRGIDPDEVRLLSRPGPRLRYQEGSWSEGILTVPDVCRRGPSPIVSPSTSRCRNMRPTCKVGGQKSVQGHLLS